MPTDAQRSDLINQSVLPRIRERCRVRLRSILPQASVNWLLFLPRLVAPFLPKRILSLSLDPAASRDPFSRERKLLLENCTTTNRYFSSFSAPTFPRGGVLLLRLFMDRSFFVSNGRGVTRHSRRGDRSRVNRRNANSPIPARVDKLRHR